MQTYNRQALNAELDRDEGRRYKPYKDSLGISTVGVGHNLVASPLPGEKYPMTDSRVDAVRDADVAKVEAALDAYIPWWRSLDDVRQRVLLNMGFNLGVGVPGGQHGLMSFKNTLELIRTGLFDAAAAAMLRSKWAGQVGARAKRLSAMMATGSAGLTVVPGVQQSPPAPKSSLWQTILAAVLSFLNRKV